MTIGFAHRGGRSGHRTNTLAAFRAALKAGVRGLESDVWLTRDGVPVLDHDGREGLLWWARPIRERNRAELARHIPTVADLYDECGAEFELSIDLKDPAAAGPLVEIARRHGAAERLWLVDEVGSRATALAAEYPDIQVVVGLADNRWPGTGALESLAASGIAAINLRRLDWKPSRIEQVHGAGMKAFGWDAHTPGGIQSLLDLGCDGIYSDDVKALVQLVSD